MYGNVFTMYRFTYGKDISFTIPRVVDTLASSRNPEKSHRV